MKGSELILGRTKIADPRIIRWNWFTKGCLEESRCSSEMNDFISRQDAIEALKGLPTWWADEGGYYGGAQPPMAALLDPEDAVSAIENLPSAQPEQSE